MQQSFLRFTTQTAAEHARRILSANGIRSTVRRDPFPNRKEGCSYALFLTGDTEKALRVVEKAGIAHNGMEHMREKK